MAKQGRPSSPANPFGKRPAKNKAKKKAMLIIINTLSINILMKPLI